MPKTGLLLTLTFLIAFDSFAQDSASEAIPDTGISGVYEVMIGTDDPDAVKSFLAQFGFALKDTGNFDAQQSKQLYGVDSALTSYRLQNHNVETHGLIRVLHWHKPTGMGVGYAQPETIGQRIMVMRTKDIFRLYDVFSDARQSGEKWLPTEPVYDDLYGMTEGNLNVLNRRVGVREMAVYGELVNLVFFQRYGYTIPDYGTIDSATPLKTSEITHNDFILPGHSKADMHSQTDYYRDVLGFKPEGPVVLDGDWQKGPQKVFNMAPGTSHWYRGFVSPNNISGKLKFFVNPDGRPDRQLAQKPGQLGITLHSLYTENLDKVRGLAEQHQIDVTAVYANEFGERSVVISGPDGSTWQVLKPNSSIPAAPTKLSFKKTLD